MITIKEVKTKREARLFTTFPNKMYKKVKPFVPALNADELKVFDKNKNPAHDYVDSIRFLAYRDNKIVGRIAGIVNHKLNYNNNKREVRFTRLDMIDDIEVTKSLLDAIINWAKTNFNANHIIGPIGFTDLDRQGMLVDGFEELNLFITIYNFPYYHKHLEQLGYVKDVDWLEKKITWPSEVPEKLSRVTNLVRNRYGYRLYKPKNMKEVSAVIDDIFKIYNDAFIDLYGFLPLPQKVVDFYVAQVKQIIQYDWIWIVYDKNDQMAGFGVVMPSLGLANKKSNGKLFPFGFLRILKALKKYDTIDFYFIGVDPKHQNRGVAALIFEDGIITGNKHGVKWAETGPELEDNMQIQSVWKDFEYVDHRRRRCYKKDI